MSRHSPRSRTRSTDDWPRRRPCTSSMPPGSTLPPKRSSRRSNGRSRARKRRLADGASGQARAFTAQPGAVRWPGRAERAMTVATPESPAALLLAEAVRQFAEVIPEWSVEAEIEALAIADAVIDADDRTAAVRTAPMLFELLLAIDGSEGTSRAWRYYDAALRIAHTACAVDVSPSRPKLLTIDALRATLLSRLHTAGIARPIGPSATAPVDRVPADVPDRAAPHST